MCNEILGQIATLCGNNDFNAESLHLDEYCSILDAVDNRNFVGGFIRTYKSFFDVRLAEDIWRRYFELLTEQGDRNRTFGGILLILLEEFRKLEVSFVSKLLAVYDRDLPIWDKNVLISLCHYHRWEARKRGIKGVSPEEKIRVAEEMYDLIGRDVRYIMGSEEGRLYLRRFNDRFPSYCDRVSDVKKIDFALWWIGRQRWRGEN